MIKEAILKVYKQEELTYEEAYETMDEIMSGKASEVQMSAYLTAMSMKGETIDEITASAEAMRAHCVRLLNDEEVVEIVGTGGDGSNTFNISTTSSIVISAAGVPVAKHGNRSASSKCGAADDPVLPTVPMYCPLTTGNSPESNTIFTLKLSDSYCLFSTIADISGANSCIWP